MSNALANPSENPFASQGYTEPQSPQNLVDRAVVLSTSLVPKLPEINIVDNMVPIIDLVYSDSGSNCEFVPNTTINFNFGNHKGKLIDWTQSRICFDVQVKMKLTDLKFAQNKFKPCLLGTKKVRLCLRNAAQVFSQVTVGGAGRPLTINDFEMVALCKHLLSTCESNTRSRIGELCTKDFPGCSTYLPDIPEITNQDQNFIERVITIPVSMPVVNVLPVFNNVDNYLNSVTTGIELRLTVSPNKGIFCLLATEEVDTSAPVTKQTGHLFWKGSTTEVIPVTNTYFYKQFRPNPCKFEGQVENKGILLMQNDAANCTHSVEMTLDRISNVRIQMISTNHPDDNIVSMLTGIALKRGLFYPHQMCICTPFNFTLNKGTTHHIVLAPVVSGYNNIDTVFIWFTERDNFTHLKKLPITNLYTSLNGSFKTPTHNYRDKINENMTECAHQFNRAFGTCNSTILSPLHEIMDAYLPSVPTNMLKSTENKYDDGQSKWVPATQAEADEYVVWLPEGKLANEQTYMRKVAQWEYEMSDSFITNSCVWELEKDSWMGGPDFSDYSNKYQIVFDVENMTFPDKNQESQAMTLWVVQRCDCYTHIRNGYMQLLTSKKEVALALAQAGSGA